DVAERVPALGNRLLEETLGDEMGFESEAAAGLQSAANGFQEIAVAVLAEVREAVAEAEGVVEVIFPGQVAHVALFEARRQLFRLRGPPGVGERFGADVHAGEVEAGSRQRDAEPAGATRYVENALAGLRLQHVFQEGELRL